MLAVLFEHGIDDAVRALVPTHDDYQDFGFDWLGSVEPFDDSAWLGTSGPSNGVGFDRGSGEYVPLIGLDVETSMADLAASVFVRAEFEVNDPTLVNVFTLAMRYDDGFIAWLNGIEIARANVSGVYPAWAGVAQAEHQASILDFEVIDLTSVTSLLQAGRNVLAIRGFNASVTDNDTLIQFTLVGENRQGPPTAVNDTVFLEENESATIQVLANDARGGDPIAPSTVAIASPPVHGTVIVNADATITYTPALAYNGPDSLTYTVEDIAEGHTQIAVLVASDSTVKTFVPRNDTFGTAWRGGEEPFDTNGWTNRRFGVGYDTNTVGTDFTPFIGSNVRLAMENENTTLYMRRLFQVMDPTAFTTLTLRMRYDDGFAAFLNGVRVASAFADENLVFNSQATEVAGNGDANATVFQDFDLTPHLGVLRSGTNVLAIHGLNGSLASSDFLIQPELVAQTPPRGRVSNAATVFLNVAGVDFAPIARDDAFAVTEGATLIVNSSSLGIDADQSVIPSESTWLYYDSSVQPFDDLQGDLWTEQVYDDSSWSSGPAQLGYGDGDEATVLRCGPNPACTSGNNITTWFRKHFTLAPGTSARIDEALLELVRDDGAAVFINGIEVVRTNLPGTRGDDAIRPSTRAVSAIALDEESAFNATVLDLSRAPFLNLLRDGDNVVAVELHQVFDSSTDVSFDLRLSLSAHRAVSVLGNDTELDGQAKTAVLQVGPQNGTLTLQPSGAFTYRPAIGFVGVNTFKYLASDGLKLSEPATVAITVDHARPTAAIDRYETLEETPLTVPAQFGVLANDGDTQNHSLSAVLVQLPLHGTVVLAADGSFRYEPFADFTGIDRFVYRAADGALESVDGTAQITVTPVNDRPSADNDVFAMAPGETLRTAATMVANYEEEVLAANPLAYWRLGEDAGSIAAIEATGRFHGVYVGGVIPGRTGALLGDDDTAADFNGANGFVEVPYRPEFQLQGGLGIVAWINADNIAGVHTIVESTSGAAGFSFSIADGRLRLTLPSQRVYETSPAIVRGGWFHVAAISEEDDEFNFYVNGAHFESVFGVFSIVESTSSIVIGGGATPFDGRIDEVAVFDGQSGIFLERIFNAAHRKLLSPSQFVWPISEGGNGHVYDYLPYHGQTWEEARQLARGNSFFGARGDLATVTSADEKAFLLAASPMRHGWLGGFQDRSAADYAEPGGGWKWVTGEPWSYNNWAAGNPDDTAGAEDYLNMNDAGGMWTDEARTARRNGFWAEYPTNLIQPATMDAIRRGATWKYRDDIGNGSPYPVDAQGDPWTESDYDDDAWPSGAAMLGYDVIDAGPIVTTLQFGGNPNNKYRTALFRRAFQAPDADRIISLAFDMLIDDGAAIYINGREVLRYFLPGTLGSNTLTTNTLAVLAGTEANYVSVIVDLGDFPGLLVDGLNTIVVEVHQLLANSSDLGFDLAMTMTAAAELLPVGVSDGDFDVDGDFLNTMLVAGPDRGALDFRGDGSFAYTPNVGFVGTDRFTYRVSDGQLWSEPATVMIVVADSGKRREDLNADGNVDAGDIAFLLASYGKPSGATAIEGDLNGDGQIGLQDGIALRNARAPSPAASASLIARATGRAAPTTSSQLAASGAARPAVVDRALLTAAVRRTRAPAEMAVAVIDDLRGLGEARINSLAARRPSRLSAQTGSGK